MNSSGIVEETVETKTFGLGSLTYFKTVLLIRIIKGIV